MDLESEIQRCVASALAEDIGDGDRTADLTPIDSQTEAFVITRTAGVFCGRAWVDAVFASLDPNIEISWQVNDGDLIGEEQVLCTLQGSARPILTGERTALNFIQTLSGTATTARKFAVRIKGSNARVRDTRKTLPGLRLAQKYAVQMGGCENHRLGLYDAILIKENHILACGSVTAAVKRAQELHPGIPLECEAETIAETEQAILAGAELVLLDNFSIPLLNKAVSMNKQLRFRGQSKALLEASGGITFETARAIADTGVDYIAIGALTKDLNSLDVSLRFGTPDY